MLAVSETPLTQHLALLRRSSKNQEVMSMQQVKKVPTWDATKFECISEYDRLLLGYQIDTVYLGIRLQVRLIETTSPYFL
jgi:hypothetical protein